MQPCTGTALPGRDGAPPTPEPVARLQASEVDLFRLLGDRLQTRCMIDVGAHHGCTLEPFLHAGWHVHAFEPVEANRQRLLARCGPHERLHLRPEAVSNRSGTRPLQLAFNLDGSLHSPYHSLERTRSDRYHRKGGVVDVPVVSLDDLIARGELPDHVGFLKVDTEGHDLAVLEGAACLQSEAVSVEFWGDRHPLGASPSAAGAMIRLMASRGCASHLVFAHQSESTCVLGSTLEGVRPDAWGNLVFFHDSRRALYEELLARLATPIRGESAGPGGDDPEMLLEQTRLLQQTCDERLEVIQRLQGVAEERLAVIQHLQGVAEERLAVIQRLQGIAEERLAVIQTLDAEVQRLRRAAGERQG